MKVKSLSRVLVGPFAVPWTVTYQAPPTMGFSRQECCSGLPFPSPGEKEDLQGIFLTQGSNPGLLHCRQMLYHLSHQGNLNIVKAIYYKPLANIILNGED